MLPGDLNQVSSELPIYDPEAPPPSPGAAALRALAVLEPGVAELQGDVEAVERAALRAVIADLSIKTSTGNSLELPFPAAQSEETEVSNFVSEFAIPVRYNIQGNFDGQIDTGNDVGILTSILSGWNDQFIPHLEAGASVSGSATEPEGDATNTSSINIGRNADGTTRFGFGSKTEATKNGVAAKTELAAFVRAEVDDDARVASTTIDLTQGTLQAKDGRQVYVETGTNQVQYFSFRSETNEARHAGIKVNFICHLLSQLIKA